MNEDDSIKIFLLELAEEAYPEVPKDEWHYKYGLTRHLKPQT